MRVLLRHKIKDIKQKNFWSGVADHCSLKSGFSLIEIVLLLAVVGIIISGVLPLFLNVITANKSAKHYAAAYKFLDSKTEEYRNMPFDSITSGSFSAIDLPQGMGIIEVDNNIDGSQQADIKLVTITVRWNFNKQNEVKTTTYIARKGLKR